MTRRRWLRWTISAILVVLAAGEGFSWSLARGWLREHLTARLSRAFGRPVEVSQYDFSVLRGLRLQAHLITVSEDPRFGQEYFLRAEELSASVRWRSLLRGRLEFSAFYFSQPSLNLVRAADGRWNLEDWLPPAISRGEPSAETGAEEFVAQNAASSSVMPQLYRIDVDNGRINIKRRADKLPFALVGVTGRVEEESPGRWRIDLEGRPTRAGAILQEVGALSVSGLIGGTSTRLRPANLRVSWQEASLSDALRLWRGYDYGIRGQFAWDLDAHSEGETWSFTSTARAVDAHRWDLPLRPSNPAVNLRVAGDWWPREARVRFRECLLEAPRSSVRAEGLVDWSGTQPGTPPEVEMHVDSSGIDLGDLMSWYRAFRPGVDDSLLVEGQLGGTLEFGGWPPQIQGGGLSIDGGRVQAPGLGGVIRLGRSVGRYRRGSLEFSPLVITFPRRSGALQVDAQARVDSGWSVVIGVAGTTERAEELLATLSAFGAALSAGWDVDGAAAIQMRWEGTLHPLALQSHGRIDLRSAVWHPPRFDRPINLGRVRIDLASGSRRLVVTDARAFGTRWNGWLERKDLTEPWHFDLEVDRLNAGDLDGWLHSPQPGSLLDRIIAVSPNPTSGRVISDAWLDSLRGRGRLQINELSFAPFLLQRVRGAVDFDRKSVRLSQAQANFYGGTVRGSFRALLSGPPAYRAELRLERVNLALLGQTSPALLGRYSGVASGELALAASGLGRENLENSLEGRGRLEIRNAADQELNWLASFAAGSPRAGPSAFQSASAEFRLSAGKIELDHLRLVAPETQLEGAGSIDFSRMLSLRLRALAPINTANKPDSVLSGQIFRLTGPLAAPQIQRLQSSGPLP